MTLYNSTLIYTSCVNLQAERPQDTSDVSLRAFAFFVTTHKMAGLCIRKSDNERRPATGTGDNLPL